MCCVLVSVPPPLTFVLLLPTGLLVTVPLVAGLILAFANGGVVPSPAVVSVEDKVCFDADQQQVLCCAWQPDGWAVAYMAWAAVILGWTTLLAFTLKVFVVSGVTAQW